MTEIKALNIGINRFRNYEQFTLRGCVNDATNFSKMLVENFQIPQQNIIELFDENATKVNIINALKSLVSDAKQGNTRYIIFHMSSHGTQVTDVDGDEADHMDEAFVCHDINQVGQEWDRDTIVVDDEMAEIVSSLPPNTIFEGFGDMCHSGSGMRDIDLQPDRKMRYIAPPHSEAVKRTIGSEIHSVRRALVKCEYMNGIWWGACGDSQTAADANIEGAGNNGAFTYYLVDAVRKSGGKISRRDLADSVRAILKQRGYNQKPELHARPEFHKYPIVSLDSQRPITMPVQKMSSTDSNQEFQIPARAIPMVLQMLWNMYKSGDQGTAAVPSKEEDVQQIQAGTESKETRKATTTTTRKDDAEQKMDKRSSTRAA